MAPVRHSLAASVRRRVFQIVCGYEDQDGGDAVRTDPEAGLFLRRLLESDADLASQPTLSRLKNGVDGRTC